MKPKLGDVMEIPVGNGKKSFAQYVYWDRNYGPLIQIFNVVTDKEIILQKIVDAAPMFPPIITGLFAAIKSGGWKVIGNVPIGRFEYPGFISSKYDEKTGKVTSWFFWDGKIWKELGFDLPSEYKEKEYLIVWDPTSVEKRIRAGGKEPFPYSDLKQFNRFDPK